MLVLAAARRYRRRLADATAAVTTSRFKGQRVSHSTTLRRTPCQAGWRHLGQSEQQNTKHRTALHDNEYKSLTELKQGKLLAERKTSQATKAYRVLRRSGTGQGRVETDHSSEQGHHHGRSLVGNPGLVAAHFTVGLFKHVLGRRVRTAHN